MNQHSLFKKNQLRLGLVLLGLIPSLTVSAGTISQTPQFLGGGSSTPLVMLVMGRDHKLYYEAYNDASDLNSDGILDTTYKPDKIDYFGLFNSFLCYSDTTEKFTPVSKTINKKCSGNWSGDFLNYLTTSRMDALRKVLYGGYRSPSGDTASGTVLERSYIPQDAHSWGKEYYTIAYDGYDIREYSPLKLPVSGKRHLFANTTLLNDTDQKPLLRVLPNSNYRIWHWLSKERPVAGSDCIGGSCETTGGTDGSHPSDSAGFTALLAKFANADHLMGTSSSATPAPSFAFNGRIDCTSGGCNPYGDDDYYVTVFKGNLDVENEDTNEDTYEISVDGDDAVEVIIDGASVVGWYGGHGICDKTPTNTGCRDAHKNSVKLTKGRHTIEFRHEEASGGDSYLLFWKGADSENKWEVVPARKFSNLVISTYDRKTSDSKIKDYVVRVDACVAGMREENNPDTSEYCRGYPAESPTVYKPAGLLQQYGEDEPERMAFGLLSGSYKKNTSGGVLRKNIGPFSKTDDSGNEVIRTTGVFNTSVKGIVNTLDNFKIVGFGGSYEYVEFDGKRCGWITTRAIQEGECRMWGNPIGEMMYESLRYFAGQPSTSAPKPTPAYDYSEATDATVPLPKADWKYPFRAVKEGGYSGAKCFMLTVSDINPSFDTDQIPGSAFTGTIDSTLPGLNVATEAATIWSNEVQSNPAFIGESLDNTPPYDGAPTPKTVSSLGRIRGLSPEEPTKQGGYYSAAVSFFGNAKGIGSTPGKQRVETMSVALASPLPRIEIPVTTKNDRGVELTRYVTLVPFAKSVCGSSISSENGKFQPTNQIVDFYVESINYADPDNGGRPHGIFQINYEDVEQGADHDMDAIVKYEFWVLDGGNIKITLTSTYAYGGITQHLGYVISGTDGQDGIYLDVRDQLDADSCKNDVDYILDTPLSTTTDADGMTLKTTARSSTAYQDSAPLPFIATRLFKPAAAGSTTATAAFIKHDPLWYAAKWGGFNDLDKDGLPDGGEWDGKVKGTPDNYYLVTNAGLLKKQLGAAFAAIQSKTGTSTVTAVNSAKVFGADYTYMAFYNSQDWSGSLKALLPSFTVDGLYKEDLKWDAGKLINDLLPSSRTILTYKPTAKKGINFAWPSTPESPSNTELDADQAKNLSLPKKSDDTYDYALGKLRLEFLRGDNTNEGGVSGKFRKRSSDLGDIINSSPLYLGAPSTRYSDTMETGTNSSYSDFRNKDRSAMVYVGSNDGMLHGFDAKTGAEKIAYVPGPVYQNLHLLTDLDYKTTETASKHRYYVDGGLAVGDAFFGNTDGWQSVLIGRLGAGGKGVFALKVTDPTSFTTDNVLWELTGDQDSDLGYTFGRSWIAKVNNGTSGEWAAIFGNGYTESDSGGPGMLYMVNVKTGAPVGSGKGKILATDPDAKDKDGNVIISGGLSSPYPYDVNDDNKVDWVYAGDRKGNLWKFDVSDTNPANWKARLLFTAQITVDADGKPLSSPLSQPITTMPLTLNNTDGGGGVLVLFGTGSYIFDGEASDFRTQSYYAIWDQESWGSDLKPGTDDDDDSEVDFARVSGRSKLLQQLFTDTKTIGGEVYRFSSGNTICWSNDGCTVDGKEVDQQFGWYIDLPFSGERVVFDSQLDGGRIIFGSNAVTETASGATVAPCDSKAVNNKSWLNMLDATSGSSLSVSFLKRGKDGVLTPMIPDDSDGKKNDQPTSWTSNNGGFVPGPSAPIPCPGCGKVLMWGNIPVFIESNTGRQSWRQITQ